MRPQSIVNFERVVLLMIVFSLAGAVINRESTTAELAARGLGGGVVMAIFAVSIAVSLLLLWLIARRRSNVARWIYVVLSAAGLAVSLAGFGSTFDLPMPAMLMQLAQLVLTILSVWLLFRPDARAWFTGSGGGNAG